MWDHLSDFEDLPIPPSNDAESIKPEPEKSRPKPVLVCLADVEPAEVKWLWPERIPLGRLTVLAGHPGEGKSWVTTDMAARVSTGTPWPDGRDCPQGSVLMLCCEDGISDTVRPRLDAHGADVSRIHCMQVAEHTTPDGARLRSVTLHDVDAIGAALESLPDCRLLVIDPIGSYLGGRSDAHRDNEVRAVLAPIAELAERHQVAIVLVAHTRKSTASRADDAVLGSRAFTGIARAVWHLMADPENYERRLLLPGKNNLSKGRDGMAFRIDGEPACVAWEPGTIESSADDMVAALAASGRSKRGPESHELNRATAWLVSLLSAGPMLAREVYSKWEGTGGSNRTLQRARKELGILVDRENGNGPWWWSLPDCQVPDAHIAKYKKLGDLGDVAQNPEFLPFLSDPESHIAKFPLLGNVDRESIDL